MNTAGELNRLMRGVGIVGIFAIVGPLVVAAIFGLFFMVLGVSILQLLLVFFELENLRSWLSVAAVFLFLFLLIAALTPSIAAGFVFAIASVYCGRNSLWVALAIVGVMVVGVVILGSYAAPAESSPLLLPSVEGLRQGAWLALFLSIPAAIAGSLCWLASRPLHRLS